MSDNHTALPWRFVPWHVEEGPSAVRAPAGHIVCTTASDADAEFIAKACNAYEQQQSEIDLLRSQVEQQQWRTIETAPKDQPILLGWRDDDADLDLVGEGYWDDGYEGDPTQPAYPAGWCIPSLNYFNVDKPTHWRLLPSLSSTECEVGA